ncbi:MAG TPA: hypothetical protein PLJ34_10575 [Hyphomicrobiales bacterium]|mgnify:CR=1 FL=1|nr:hypothetical protein [Kaistiaceae bacterium]HQF31876.1 hypothetical protein [Hyphomicrobiales bacterium]
MTGRINTYRAAVPATLRPLMPALKTCEAQLGRFDLDRLEKTSLRTPAVLVGILAAPLKVNANATSSVFIEVAAFAVTGGPEAKRDDAAWAIAEVIAATAHSTQRWGLDDIGEIEKVKISPVLSSALSDRGVSIVVVQWTQKLNGIGTAILEAGVLPPEVYINDEEVSLDDLFEEAAP